MEHTSTQLGPTGPPKPNGRTAMQALAEKQIDHHTQPLPEAHPPQIEPFPRRVVAGLWLGVAVGALAGLVFGQLLLRNLVLVPGWEALYSMGPFTFVTFWVLMGVALGMLTVGIGAVVVGAPAETPGPALRD